MDQLPGDQQQQPKPRLKIKLKTRVPAADAGGPAPNAAPAAAAADPAPNQPVPATAATAPQPPAAASADSSPHDAIPASPGLPPKPTPARASKGSGSKGRGSGGAKSSGGAAAGAKRTPEALLASLKEFVLESNGPWEDGWRCEVKVRQEGNSFGTTDTYYFSPSGRRFRSRPEIVKFLGLDGGPGGAPARPSGGQKRKSGASDAAAPPAPPERMPRAEAAAQAQATAAQLSTQQPLPLALANGVLVHVLGALDARPGFCAEHNLWPVGYRAVLPDPSGCSFLCEILDGGSAPRFEVSLVAPGGMVQWQGPGGDDDDDEAQGAAEAGAAGPSHADAMKVDGAAEAGAAAGATSAMGGPVKLAAADSPDAAWQQVAKQQQEALKLQARLQQAGSSRQAAAAAAEGPGACAAGTSATAEPAAAAPAAPAMVPALHEAAQLLCAAQHLKGAWGLSLFGLADPTTRQLLEGLPGAEACTAYTFTEQRCSWQQEAAALAQGPGVWARHLAGKPAQEAGRKRARAAGPQGDGLGPARHSTLAKHFKRDRSASREDREIQDAVVRAMERVLGKVESWWEGEEAKEARRREKEAAKEAAKQARISSKAPHNSSKPPAHDGPQPAPTPTGPHTPEPPVEDLSLPGAASCQPPPPAPALAALQGAPAAALLRAWEFGCRFCGLLGLGQPPSLTELEAAVAAGKAGKGRGRGAVAGASGAAKAGGGEGEGQPPAADAWTELHVALVQLLVGDAYDAVLAALMPDLPKTDLKAVRPKVDAATWPEAARRYLAAAATAQYLAQGEPKSSAAAGAAVHLPGQLASMEAADWLQCLVGGLNAPNLVSRIALLPQHNSETAAESLLALDDAAALAAAERTLQAVGAAAAGAAAAANGAQAHASDEQAAGAAPIGDAAARGTDGAAAGSHPAVGGLAGAAATDNGAAAGSNAAGKAPPGTGSHATPAANGATTANGDAVAHDDTTHAEPAASHAAALLAGAAASAPVLDPEEAARQLLVCRRLLYALTRVKPRKGHGGGGERMVFFAQELAPAVRAHKGLDLHCVAARLEKGLYHMTGQPLQAMAADVRAACDLWRLALSRYVMPGFEDAVPDLGDRVEDKLEVLVARVEAGDDLADVAAAAGADADVAAGATAAAAAPSTPQLELNTNGDADPAGSQQQQQQQQQQLGGRVDKHGLCDPSRPFNPLSGCRVCWRGGDVRRLLMCDSCDAEYHCYCVDPPLLEVPDGDWYCPPCRARASSSGASSSALQLPFLSVRPVRADAGSPVAATADVTGAPAAAILQIDERRSGMREVAALLSAASALGSGAGHGPHGSSHGYESWAAGQKLELLGQLVELALGGRAVREALGADGEARHRAAKELAALKAQLKRQEREARAAARASAAAAAGAIAGAAAGGSAAGGAADGKVAAGRAASRAATPAAAGAAAPQGDAGHGGDGDAAAAADAAEAEPTAEAAAAGPTPEGTPSKKRPKGGAGGKRGRGGGKASTGGATMEGNDAATQAAGGGKDVAAKGGGRALRGTEEPLDPAAALERIALLERQVELLADRRLCLGLDRHHNRYWLLGTLPCDTPEEGPGGAAKGLGADQGLGAAGVVFVERAPVAEGAGPKTRGSRGSSAQQQQLQPPAGDDGSSSSSSSRDGGGWGVYGSVGALNGLIEWLDPRGVREGQLKAALLQVRDAMAKYAPMQQHRRRGQQEQQQEGSAAPAAAAAAAAAAAQDAGGKQAEEGDAAAPMDVDCQSELVPAASLPAAVNGDAKGHATAAAGAVSAANGSEAASPHEAAAAAMRAQLSALFERLPDECFHEFWGQEGRRGLWRAALQNAPTPGAFAALVALLDVMLLGDSFRPAWGMWALPAQHPAFVATWEQLHYRVTGLLAGLKRQLPTREQVQRHQMLRHKAAYAAAKAAGAVAGGKEAGGEWQRYPLRDKTGPAHSGGEASGGTQQQHAQQERDKPQLQRQQEQQQRTAPPATGRGRQASAKQRDADYDYEGVSDDGDDDAGAPSGGRCDFIRDNEDSDGADRGRRSRRSLRSSGRKAAAVAVAPAHELRPRRGGVQQHYGEFYEGDTSGLDDILEEQQGLDKKEQQAVPVQRAQQPLKIRLKVGGGAKAKEQSVPAKAVDAHGPDA